MRHAILTGAKLTIAVLGLGLGGYLVWDYVASIPPNPREASTRRVIGFLFSDGFEGLTAARKRKYTRALVDRWGELSDRQRERVKDQMKQMREDRPDQMRDRMVAFWKNYVVSEAEKYVKIPPDQREAWLTQRVAGWRAMFDRGGDQRGRERRGERRRERRDRPLGREDQAKMVHFFRERVMPRSSARERALVSVLARDARDHFDR